MAFVDSRRFGRIRVAQKPEESPPLSDLGPDAFLQLPNAPALGGLLRTSQRAIKAVLLDQAVLSGIGNWVADEVLYQARVHPETRASALSEDHCVRLHETIQQVLSVSIGVNADSSQFPDSWLFHVRWDKKPGSIGGHKISFITVGGRTSAVVPAVQKQVGGSTGASFGRKGSADKSRKPAKKRKRGEDDGDEGDSDADEKDLGEEDEEEKAGEKEEGLASNPRKRQKVSNGVGKAGADVKAAKPVKGRGRAASGGKEGAATKGTRQAAKSARLKGGHPKAESTENPGDVKAVASRTDAVKGRRAGRRAATGEPAPVASAGVEVEAVTTVEAVSASLSTEDAPKRAGRGRRLLASLTATESSPRPEKAANGVEAKTESAVGGNGTTGRRAGTRGSKGGLGSPDIAPPSPEPQSSRGGRGRRKVEGSAVEADSKGKTRGGKASGSSSLSPDAGLPVEGFETTRKVRALAGARRGKSPK